MRQRLSLTFFVSSLRRRSPRGALVCASLIATATLPGCAWTLVSTADAIGSMTQAGFSVASNYSSPSYVNGAPLRVNRVCVEINNGVAVNELVPALRVALQRSNIDTMVYNAGTSPPDCPAILTYTATIDYGHRAYSDSYTRYLSSIDLRLSHGNQVVVAHYQTEGLNLDRFNSTASKMSSLVRKMVTRAGTEDDTVMVATRAINSPSGYGGSGVYSEPIAMSPTSSTALGAMPSLQNSNSRN